MQGIVCGCGCATGRDRSTTAAEPHRTAVVVLAAGASRRLGVAPGDHRRPQWPPDGRWFGSNSFVAAVLRALPELGLALPPGILLGVASGLLVGFVIVPLSLRFLQFHKGLSLYNIGFTAGILGMFFMAILSGFGVEVHAVSILSGGRNLPFSILLFGIFLAILLLGLRVNHWRMKGFRRLLQLPGVLPTDFLATSGFGVTLINMALLGILSVVYVLAPGGELNGPVIGGIFTVVGFGAYGKHIKNVLPVIAGVTLANLFNIHDSAASYTLIAALFGTTLAPIAGRYGVVAGMIAGFLHMSLVTNIGFLHAGMNLYNNGFSGGFVAALLCPLYDAAEQIRRIRKP